MSTKSVSRYKKLVTTQVENLHAVSHFNTKHLVFCTTPKSFRTTVKESLKRTTSSKWAVKYFHALVSTVNYVSPIGANGD